MKTSELTGAALDWAVAKAEGLDVGENDRLGWYPPSTNWAHGGPIIEREGIGVYMSNGAWNAHCPVQGSKIQACMDDQPTPLIAAMRCYVASKMGDEVEIPEGLNHV